MQVEPEISGASILLLGHFSPAVFTPAWFALREVLPKPTGENAESRIAHLMMQKGCSTAA